MTARPYLHRIQVIGDQDLESSTNEAIRALGKFYCAVYLISLTACALALWLYWDAWRLDNLITQIGNVSSASVGIAFLATICREAAWSMVLATMRAIKLKEEARKEGRQEGRAEERKRRRKQEEAALSKFGVEVNGVLMLPQTPEVREFLEGEPDEE